jgi:iron complex outermembrane recepter protein
MGRFESRNTLFATVMLLVFGLPLTSEPSAAQAADDEDVVDEIVITGSRRLASSPSDVPSPVTIIAVDDLRKQGSTDMVDMIRKLVPSFNVTTQAIGGTASVIRPPNLRGLGADHTLVLVNGKRRHRAANIPNFSGGINDGTQGADISTIPSIALKRVDILRDGAAAQYGSDAIAGIMNFIANDDPDARFIEVRTGQRYKGDGTTTTVSGIFGFALPNDGSLNISGEYTDRDITNRAQQSDGNQAFADAGYPVRDPAIWWGTPGEKGYSVFANLVAPLSNGAEFYGFASYNNKENTQSFFIRNPAQQGVFAIGSERLIFDTTGNGSGNCPALTVPDLGDSAAVAADMAAMEALRGDPNCFSFAQDFPGGITPWFTGLSKDYMASAGLRGTFGNDLAYDISYTMGQNDVRYTSFDTFNTTFGPDSPNFLDAGSRVQDEQTFNAQLSYPWETGLASAINVTAGFEWREEKYAQNPGQREAWDVGPYTQSAQGSTGIVVGMLGFGAFSPTNSFSRTRDNTAVYLDLEGDITDRWTLGGAVRYENFSDIGGQTTYKIATLFDFTDNVGVRATYSTGFHAPSPGQQTFSQSTDFFDAQNNLVTTSVLPADIAADLPSFAGEAKPLTPETSTNFSVGMFWDTDIFSLTVDLYRIDVSDRITLTEPADIDDADRQALFDLGFTNAGQFCCVNFFTNDFDTRTEGIDVIASMPFGLGNGDSEISVAYNYTNTEVTRQGPNLSDLRLAQLEQQIPKSRGNIQWTHAVGRWSGFARVNYFGKLHEYYLALSLDTAMASETTVDVQVNFDATDSLRISLGAENMFDSFPTKASTRTLFGNTYPVSAPNGFDGGFYYAKLGYNF